MSSEEKFIKEMGKINQSSQKEFDKLLESKQSHDNKRIEKASDAIKSGGIDEKDKAGLSDEAKEEKGSK
ncbi:MAG: hypothetical protein RDV48_01125 [Candidatus Eremiobacteraeota bacterium]|nr:hypothetical protein [Candidatus Eremiobacteraeota bacterium]